MSEDDPQLLVSTDWLEPRLGNPDLHVLDASWHLPAEGRNPRAEYDRAHLPGAQFFDIDEISDQTSDLPHMAPPPETFAARVRELGIGDGDQVVVYDAAGMFSAARVWWLFRLFGKTDVAVLDGGLPKWLAEGRPVETARSETRPRSFTAKENPLLVRDATEVAATVERGDAQIVDARSPGRFSGEEPEARPGLRSGHIPGSKNVYYRDLLNPDGTMKEAAELQTVFEAAGVDLERPAVTTCGSGVTAAILSLALERIGHRDHALYDGSWSEWGGREDLKVETGRG